MLGRIIGGILLIIGTSIGAGMLALPTATAVGGFYHTALFMVGAWLVMTIGALYMLEANLWLPEDSNLVSMAGMALGVPGRLITWVVYTFFLFALLAAYVAGGADLLKYLLGLIHITISTHTAAVWFVIIFGGIVSYGVRLVDLSNRSLMSAKMAAFFILVLLVIPHVHPAKLSGGHMKLLGSSIMLLFTAFGFASILPTLRSYLKSDVRALRIVVWGGSFLSLLCYLAWNFAVQGTLNGEHLAAMARSGQSSSMLTAALSAAIHSKAVDYLTHIFTAICVTTSFLGVSLAVTDFVADGLNVRKIGKQKWMVILATFLPPLAIVLVNPALFIKGLTYAGVCCVILLMLLPGLIVCIGRYKQKRQGPYKVSGGVVLIAAEILISVALLIKAILMLS